MNKIQNQLNELWASVINSYEFNILNHTITLDVTFIENRQRTKYNIKFKGVSSYHFYENSGERRINPVEPDDGDYLELTSIQFYKDGIGNMTIKSQVEKWAEQYYSNANFALEIWDSMLFIEANNVIVNGIEYEVKYYDD